MTSRKTYKNLLTGFLLLLYLFIATPVQLWHSHSAGYATDKVCHQTGDDLISPGQGTDNGSDCKICSHSYSVHASDGLASAGIRIYFDAPRRPDLFFTPVESPRHLFANKSPPSLLPSGLV